MLPEFIKSPKLPCIAIVLCIGLNLVPSKALSSPALPVANGQSWATLSDAQQQVLSPLAKQWHRLDENSQAKWLNIADRYPNLPPDSQQRVLNRMKEWANLPDNERDQARLRFQQAQQLSPQERHQRWQAYQALPPQEKKDLARLGWRKKNPVFLEKNQFGPPELGQAQSLRSRHEISEGKQNLALPKITNAPIAIAPGTVQGGSGATTSLVNQSAIAPMHQHTGLPKINATQDFVNPQTLLPLRGQQGAGMLPPTIKP